MTKQASVLSRLESIVSREGVLADVAALAVDGLTPQAAVAPQPPPAGPAPPPPLTPPGGERATIGGILAANASGPWRHAFGSARDMTIGLRVVTAEGRITRAGGRGGTLGVIGEATFKLAPLPRERRTALATFATAADACAFAAALRRRGLSVRSITLVRDDGGYALALDIAGSPAAVERSWREITDLTRDVSAGITAAPPDALTEDLQKDDSLLCKASVLPSRLPSLIDALEALEAPRLLAHPTIGVCYAAWPSPHDTESVAGAVRELTSAAGGTLVLERCPLDLKHRVDAFGEPPASIGLMRRVKEQFDPKGVPSPGRFVGRL